MSDDYRSLARARILEDDTFARATFSGPEKGSNIPWLRAVIRPVLLRGDRHWQFSYFDEKKDITKNYLRLEAGRKLDELIDSPFRNLTVETAASRLEVRRTKKGRPLVRQTALQPPDHPNPATRLAHDRVKHKWISAESDGAAIPFLQAVKIMTADGRVRADMQSKLRQINEFVRLLDETGAFDRLPAGQPVRAVDFGSGNGYLTFAFYYYLTAIKGLPADLTGVDLKADLLEKLNARAHRLGWSGLHFQPGAIEDYRPEQPPDVVIALHACDTATDEALAQGIRWGSRLIVTAPCCQHELQAQMDKLPLPDAFGAVVRHGVLFERLGDVLTDAARAAILRVMGYRAEVIQFISTEHTAKNLMIRAVRAGKPGSPRALEEYRALKAYWGVTPYLERLLSAETDLFME